MSARTEHQHGFTLLEVLIAIAILAGLAMVLAPTISTAARASARIHGAAEAREALYTGSNVFETIIRQALIFESNRDNGFVGSAHSMTVVSIDPLSGDPAIFVFELNQQDAILYLQTPAIGANRQGAFTLLNGLDRARFEYFGNHQGAVLKSWRAYWRGDQLPELIRLTAQRRQGQHKKSIVVEAAPAARAPLHCKFDPVSRVCRG